MNPATPGPLTVPLTNLDAQGNVVPRRACACTPSCVCRRQEVPGARVVLLRDGREVGS